MILPARFSPLLMALTAALMFPAKVPLLAAAPPGPELEPVVAADLNHSGRSAILLRAEDFKGLIGFIPTSDGGWRFNRYPQPDDVAAFAAADFDGDGNTDLLIIRRNGEYATWLGDGQGNHHPKGLSLGRLREFKPTIVRTEDLNGDLRPDLTLLDERGRRLELINDGFGNLSLRTAGTNRPEAVAAPAADFAGDGLRETVVARGNRLWVRRPDGDPVELVSPFRVRAFAIGEFTGDVRPDVAAVGFGERPELVIFENRSTAASALSFTVARPEILSVTHTITACYPSFCSADNGTPNITVSTGDTVTWAGLIGHTATQTTGPGSCTTLTGGFDNAGANPYSRVFPAAGSVSYKCNVLTTLHCNAGMHGTITITAPPPTPGTVPDSGTPLLLSKSGAANLGLSWGASCSATVAKYIVYEGTVGTWYSHAPMNCALGNVTATTVAPAAGNTYYLIVAATAGNEGSYGLDSSAAEIPPPAAGACLPQNLAGSC